ncbi:HNH endonuclease [Acidaminobacter sp. JC074]|uniref:HNH endonuclease n=1 Tax=Acidaminobacter sp. JC074 TaxID=2530199 RepID=UPI001F0E082F|nr:HNH endonuclease [Acidaminobacter sp. JC074]MCH4891193.1 HNH endonuclease [Acidaminobacter sp. JC074]
MPKKICRGKNCKNLVPMNGKYCPQCAKVAAMDKQEKNKHYDQNVREPKLVNFYHSKEWQKVRQAALLRDYHLCQECLKHNVIKSAEIVHHIIEIKDDWSKRLQIDNCQSVCKSCHNKLHI